jgi:hypothetical protein
LSVSLSLSLFLVLESQGNVTFLEAQKGQVLQLLCTAEGQPPVTLSWALENRVLSRSHPTGSRTLGLELPGVKPGDAGHYTCRAENRLGSQDRTLDLSVQCEWDRAPVPGVEQGKGTGDTTGFQSYEGTGNQPQVQGPGF